MNFVSSEFLYLFILILFFYYLPFARQYQVHILTAGSLIFYALGQPIFLPLLLFSGFISSVLALKIKKDRYSSQTLKIGIAINLFILSWFKYKHLIFSEFSSGSPILENPVSIFLGLPLPIGISFYSFQGISLLVDTFKSNSAAENDKFSLTNIFFYMVFFPKIIAGPIVKAHQFIPQIGEKRFRDIDWVVSCKWLVSGYFFKCYVADNLNQITAYMAFPVFEKMGSGDLFIFIYIYSIQIYADFAGYSAIAIGLAGCLGYKLPINFNLPYLSKSFSEFWTRWHITLSNFLKEYLYFPLGGNRKGSLRTYLNMVVVMALGGLWHGAAYSFLAWGSLHGILLSIERPLLRCQSNNFTGVFSRILSRVLPSLRILFVFSCVSFAWIFFKINNFTHVVEYMAQMVSFEHGWFVNTRVFYLLCAIYSAPVIIHHLCHSLTKLRAYRFVSPVIYASMAALAYLDLGETNAFIYFQF